MSCSVTEEIIYDYLDGELDELTSLIIGEHIAECGRCSKKAAQARALLYEMHRLENENIQMPVELDEIIDKVCKSERIKGITLRDYVNIQKEILKKEVAFINYIPGRRLGSTTVTALFRGAAKASGFLFRQGYKMTFSRG